MKQTTQPANFRRFRFFCWNIYITRNLLRARTPRHNRQRTHSKVERLIDREHHCELCGRTININCTLFRLLPRGAEGRNDMANVRVICPECHQFVQTLGAYRPMIPMVKEGGAI